MTKFKNLKLRNWNLIRKMPKHFLLQSKTNFKFQISNLGLAVLFLFLFSKPVMAANSGNFTMSLWVNPSGSVASKALVSKAEEFRVFTNASGYPGCQIKTTSWQTAATSTTAISVGSWSQVVCTYDLVNLKVYVNGVLKATQALTSLPDDTAAVLRIGQDDSASTTYTNLAGIVDEFKFYNFALTSDEILTEYNHGSALALGSLSDTSGLTGGSVASNSASAAYCISGDTTSCAPPVAEWNFEEGSGTSVADTSGNSNTGTWSGSGNHWVAGKIGKAGGFNGGNDYVSAGTLGNFGSTALANAFTIELFIKTTSTAKTAVLGSTAWGTGLQLIINSTPDILSQSVGKFAFWLRDNAQTPHSIGTTNATNFNNGNWHHIVYIRSGNNDYLYLDGVNQAVTVGWSALSALGSFHNIGEAGEAFTIGATNTRGTVDSWTNGSLDQVRIFNYARTPAQIAWDYNRGGPVGWWKMNECTGTVIHDSSGNNNTGTLTNATAGTCDDGTSTTAWGGGKTGKYGSSLKFDGVDDYVDTPNQKASTNFTMSAWINKNSAGLQTILAQGNSGATDLSFYLRVGSNSVGSGFTTAASTYKEVVTPDVSLNVWHHILVTYDGASLKYYLDGKLSNSASITGTPESLSNHTVIGRLGDFSGQYFSGQIDDVRIFNYALTATQVKTLFNENAAVRFGP